MKDYCFSRLQYVLPQHPFSRLLGKITQCRWPFFTKTMINGFIKLFNVNVEEAASTNLDDYPTFQSFFIRALKEGARPISSDSRVIVSPADGTISQLGTIKQNLLFQAKKHDFSLEALLANKEDSKHYENGEFITVYLSPKDYHRVHMPFDGILKKMTYIPGKLFSVNNASVNHIPGLFARNERVVCHFDTEKGPMAVIMVGAMLVSSIHTTWAGTLTPRKKKTLETTHYTQTITLKKGEELGYFNYGSTVILLFPKNTPQWQNTLKSGDTVKMGETLGLSS